MDFNSPADKPKGFGQAFPQLSRRQKSSKPARLLGFQIVFHKIHITTKTTPT